MTWSVLKKEVNSSDRKSRYLDIHGSYNEFLLKFRSFQVHNMIMSMTGSSHEKLPSRNKADIKVSKPAERNKESGSIHENLAKRICVSPVITVLSGKQMVPL